LVVQLVAKFSEPVPLAAFNATQGALSTAAALDEYLSVHAAPLSRARSRSGLGLDFGFGFGFGLGFGFRVRVRVGVGVGLRVRVRAR